MSTQKEAMSILVEKWRMIQAQRHPDGNQCMACEDILRCADELETLCRVASPDCATCQGTRRVWSGPMKESTVECPDCRAASSTPEPSHAKVLFDAVKQAVEHLYTTMNLESHPKSCKCYGCNLRKARTDYALEEARLNVKPIVDRELEAERRTRALQLGPASSTPPSDNGEGRGVYDTTKWIHEEHCAFQDGNKMACTCSPERKP
jgi:hypothetical protein